MSQRVNRLTNQPFSLRNAFAQTHSFENESVLESPSLTPGALNSPVGESKDICFTLPQLQATAAADTRARAAPSPSDVASSEMSPLVFSLNTSATKNAANVGQPFLPKQQWGGRSDPTAAVMRLAARNNELQAKLDSNAIQIATSNARIEQLKDINRKESAQNTSVVKKLQAQIHEKGASQQENMIKLEAIQKEHGEYATISGKLQDAKLQLLSTQSETNSRCEYNKTLQHDIDERKQKLKELEAALAVAATKHSAPGVQLDKPERDHERNGLCIALSTARNDVAVGIKYQEALNEKFKSQAGELASTQLKLKDTTALLESVRAQPTYHTQTGLRIREMPTTKSTTCCKETRNPDVKKLMDNARVKLAAPIRAARPGEPNGNETYSASAIEDLRSFFNALEDP